MPKRIVKKHKAFIAAFKETASIKVAAKLVNIHRSVHYDWIRDVPGYKALFDASVDEAAQTIEDEITRRAVEGVVEAVYYEGKVIGGKRVYSDALAMFLLRGLRPQKYRHSMEISGPAGGAIEAALTVTFVKP